MTWFEFLGTQTMSSGLFVSPLPSVYVSLLGTMCPPGEKVDIGVPMSKNFPTSLLPPFHPGCPSKTAVQFLLRAFPPSYYFCPELPSQHSLYGCLSYLSFIHQLKYPLLDPGLPPHYGLLPQPSFKPLEVGHCLFSSWTHAQCLAQCLDHSKCSIDLFERMSDSFYMNHNFTCIFPLSLLWAPLLDPNTLRLGLFFCSVQSHSSVPSSHFSQMSPLLRSSSPHILNQPIAIQFPLLLSHTTLKGFPHWCWSDCLRVKKNDCYSSTWNPLCLLIVPQNYSQGTSCFHSPLPTS